VPLWAKVLIGVASLALIVLVVWLVARPSPWRSGFSSCTYGGYVSAQCGTVAVPADPRHPGGATIGLHVAVLTATQRPARGALFYLEGGPGGAATASAIQVNQFFAEIGRTHDLVMVDQRGMGRSAPLACPARPVRADDAVAVTAYLRSCFAHLSGDARLDSTAAAAVDLEAVRRKLGYGRIDVYGGSYGATLAQAYLARYPKSVRSVVLDSGSLPNVRVFDTSARNAQQALDRLLVRCTADRSCGQAYRHTQSELAALLRRPPVKITVPQGTYVLRPDDIAWTINALAESTSGAITIPYAIHAAYRHDYIALAEAFGNDVGRVLDERAQLAAVWVILCSEPWAQTSPDVSARSYLSAAAMARARLFRRECSVVPREVPLGGGAARFPGTPVLMLAGGEDPLDPAANLGGWRKLYPDGRVVVVPDAAHGTIGLGCVQHLVAEFVARGSARGLDASCVDRVTPLPFETG
jgi:pimeloyl-ACP methyl ester carboxylesterase